MATFAALRSALARRTLIALAVVVGLLAPLALHAGSASAATSTSFASRTASEIRMNHAVLHLLNHERADHGLPKLHLRRKLSKSAHEHNVGMARFDTMSHQLPHEAYVGTRVEREGYNWSWVGENIAWNSQMNTQGVLAEERAMYNEKPPADGHRLNILGKHYTDIGIDVFVDRLHHKIWLTTDFGRKMH